MMYPEVRFFYCLGCDPEQPSYTFGNTIRICQTFLDKMWRDPAYDDCGVMYSNPCPSAWGDDADFDPYMCGDSLLLPRQEFDDNVTRFINVFKPPGLDDYDFVPIDDRVIDGVRVDDTPCWIARTYQNSAAGGKRTGGASWLLTAALVLLTAALPLRS